MIDPMVIPLAGIALPVVLVPVILCIKYARYERELEHAERIKALELGRTLPKDEPWWTLPRIAVPTLVIVGDLDASGVLAAADLLAQGIAGAQKVVIPGTAHMLSMEKPEEFNQVVLDFLGKL